MEPIYPKRLVCFVCFVLFFLLVGSFDLVRLLNFDLFVSVIVWYYLLFVVVCFVVVFVFFLFLSRYFLSLLFQKRDQKEQTNLLKENIRKRKEREKREKMRQRKEKERARIESKRERETFWLLILTPCEIKNRTILAFPWRQAWWIGDYKCTFCSDLVLFSHFSLSSLVSLLLLSSFLFNKPFYQ